MTLEGVEFVADEQPPAAIPIDATLVQRWRNVIGQRLRYYGAGDARTSVEHRRYGRTFVSSVPIGHGDHLAVWWAFRSNDVALVLAVRMSEPDPEIEEPPEF